MNNKQELNQIFSDMLGITIILDEEKSGYDEKAFIKVIENWERAWFVKNELIDKYGILWEGIDNLLFSALEEMIVLMYGEKKSEMIQWYIYENKDENNKPTTLVDPNTKKSYTLSTPKDLYDFIQLEFDIDNLPSIEDEDDDDDEEN